MKRRAMRGNRPGNLGSGPVLSVRMERLLKTYATRLARKHVLKRVGASGLSVLETEEQLLEMAHSRLREELLGMDERLEDTVVARAIRKEAAVIVERYADDADVRATVRAEIEAMSDSEILPRLH